MNTILNRGRRAGLLVLAAAGPLLALGCGGPPAVPEKDRALVERLRIVRDMVDDRATQLEVAATFSKTHPREVTRGVSSLFDDVVPIVGQLSQCAAGTPVESDVKSLETEMKDLSKRLKRQREPLERIRSSTESFQQRLADIEQRVLQ